MRVQFYKRAFVAMIRMRDLTPHNEADMTDMVTCSYFSLACISDARYPYLLYTTVSDMIHGR